MNHVLNSIEFYGDGWDDRSRAKIVALFSKYITRRVVNFWQIQRTGTGKDEHFICHRRTWDLQAFGGSFEELSADLEDYYK